MLPVVHAGQLFGKVDGEGVTEAVEEGVGDPVAVLEGVGDPVAVLEGVAKNAVEDGDCDGVLLGVTLGVGVHDVSAVAPPRHAEGQAHSEQNATAPQENVPTGHLLQLEAPSPLKVPAGQLEQTGAPAALLKVPATQGTQVPMVAAPRAVLLVPAGQAVHCVWPGAAYVPAGQVRHEDPELGL